MGPTKIFLNFLGLGFSSGPKKILGSRENPIYSGSQINPILDSSQTSSTSQEKQIWQPFPTSPTSQQVPPPNIQSDNEGLNRFLWFFK